MAAPVKSSTPPDTRANIMVERDDVEDTPRAEDIVGWVMSKVPAWRKDRDSEFKQKWDEYYHIWRGEWTPESRNRKSERSRLISPATQMAVDLTVAEIVEALLGRENWFDLPDDVSDEEKEDADRARALLLEDLKKDGIITNLIQIVQTGALYGQLIAKIVTEVREEPQAIQVKEQTVGVDGQPQEITKTVKGFNRRVAVYPVPVEPGQLVFDTSGSTSVDDMLGVAHEFPMGIHKIERRQAQGIYRNVKVGKGHPSWEMPTADRDGIEQGHSSEVEWCRITEWHGLVPRKLLAQAMAGTDDPVAMAASEAIPPYEMVEAIVTIADESLLLRAIANPSVMDDRAIVAEQFDTVPNRFWGRGIVEKAYNSQKGLDMEIRARADSLAWVNNPMMAGNLSKLPPRMNLDAWPGKFWGLRGNPKESLTEFRFGDINQSTFVHAQEMERMVQQATGAQDPASLRNGMRDETAVGSGIAASGMVKRSKRTMYHIESFLSTLLRRILWRKMQFEPDRYPQDFNFLVKGTMGMMAREIEVAQSVQLMNTVDKGSLPQLLLLRSIFEQSNHPNKASMVKALDQMMKPDPEQQKKQQQMEALNMMLAQAQLQETRAKTAKLMADAGLAGAKEMLTKIEAQFKDDEVMIEHMRANIDVEQVRVQQEQIRQNERSLDIQEKKVNAEANRVKGS